MPTKKDPIDQKLKQIGKLMEEIGVIAEAQNRFVDFQSLSINKEEGVPLWYMPQKMVDRIQEAWDNNEEDRDDLFPDVDIPWPLAHNLGSVYASRYCHKAGFYWAPSARVC